MQDVFENLPVYMMIGIVVVIGVSQISRVAGGVLSVVFWGIVAFVGLAGYDAGHQIGFLGGFMLPKPVFLLICAGFAGTHAFAAYAHVRSKRRAEAYRRAQMGE